MKLFKLFTLALLVLMIASLSIYAADAKQETKKQDPVILKNQTNCPVMGGVIDSSTYTDIQGQRVYHCCPMCSKKLKADPDKYFQESAKAGVLFENIQTTCPVSGKKLENKLTVLDFEGRHIYFSSQSSLLTFKKNPQKYLTQIDKPVEKVKEVKKENKHEGHNH